MAKVPADRFESVAEFANAIGSGKTSTYRAIRAAKIRRRASYVGAAALVGLAVGIGIGRQSEGVGSRGAVTRRTLIGVGAGEAGTVGVSFALSHDGRSIVLSDPSDPEAGLLLRPLERLTISPIAGTARGASPFLSWDSRTLGFRRGSEIFVVAASGGAAVAVPNVRASALGTPDWTPDGRIVFTDTLGRLAAVKPDGTGLVQLTSPSPARAHLSPRVLPQGRGVLFTIVEHREGRSASRGVGVVSLQTGELHELAESGATAAGFDAGYLLYVRADGTLMAFRFDVQDLRSVGAPFPLGDRVDLSVDGAAVLNVGRDLLVYRSAGALVALSGWTAQMPR